MLMERGWMCIFQLDIMRACQGQIYALLCVFCNVVLKQMELKLKKYQCIFLLLRALYKQKF